MELFFFSHIAVFFPIYEGQNLRQNFFFAWKEILKKPKTKKILDENSLQPDDFEILS